jgi:hypothetical protein
VNPTGSDPAAPLTDAARATATARAAEGAPHPDPSVRGLVVATLRAENRRVNRRDGMLAAAVIGVAAVAGIAAAVAGLVEAGGLLAAALVLAVVLLGFIVRTGRAGNRRHRIITLNLRAHLDDLPAGTPGPVLLRAARGSRYEPLVMACAVTLGPAVVVINHLTHRTVSGYVWPTVVALCGIAWWATWRHHPRPPVRIDADGLAFPRIGLALPWSCIGSVEVARPERLDGPLAHVVWHLRDLPADVPPRVLRHLREKTITIREDALADPPEGAITATRAYLATFCDPGDGQNRTHGNGYG